VTDRRPPSALDQIAFLTLAAALSVIQLSIAYGESLLGISIILWLVLLIRGESRPALPDFLLPLGVFAALTLASTAASADRWTSLREDKQLLLYLIVPVVMTVARGSRAGTITNAIIAVGAVSAFVGLVQGVMIDGLSYDVLMHNRPHGLVGHFMTYSGLLMLVVCTAAAQLIYRDRDWLWPAVAVPALLVALAVTMSRNVWIGTLAALTTLLVLRRPRLTWAVPVAVALALLIAPVRSRARDIFDPTNVTNLDRVSMLKSGEAMVADHWLLGVGPNMVPAAYLEHYKRADAVDPDDQKGSTRAHLHNVVVQIAAERGIPALVAWFWFIGVAIHSLWRQTRIGPSRALAAAGVAAIVAMLTAGMFEHNFGDSEFLVLFLGLITLPYAARRPA
jgi:O-antigen ligase